MYLGLPLDVLEPNQITDYWFAWSSQNSGRGGRATVNMFGARNFALRAWLDPVELAATA